MIDVMLTRHAAALLAGSVAFASCSAQSSIWLATEDAATIVLVLGSGDDLRATVIDATEPDAVSRITTLSSDTDGYAFLFTKSHGELRVMPGDRAFAPTGLSLGEADAVRALHFDDDVPVWESLGAAPNDLANLRVEVVPPCQTLAIDARRLPGTAGQNPGFAITIGPNRMFVGTREGTFFDVSPDGTTALSNIPTDTPSYAAFFDARTDEVWLVGHRGRMMVGHPDRGFETAPRMNTFAPYIWIDGSVGDTPFELFALTSTGTLERFDGSQWTSLSPLPEVPTETRSRWGVAWSAPGSAVAIGFGNEIAVMAHDGVTEMRQLAVPPQPEFSSDALYSIAHVPGFGALIGTRYGRLFQLADAEWVLLPQPLTDVRASTITSFEDGLFVGGQRGIFWQYFPDWGYCTEAVYSFGELYSIVSLEQGPALFEDAADSGDELTIVFLSKVETL